MSARSDETTQGFTTPHFIQNQILKYMYNICKVDEEGIEIMIIDQNKIHKKKK